MAQLVWLSAALQARFSSPIPSAIGFSRTQLLAFAVASSSCVRAPVVRDESHHGIDVLQVEQLSSRTTGIASRWCSSSCLHAASSRDRPGIRRRPRPRRRPSIVWPLCPSSVPTTVAAAAHDANTNPAWLAPGAALLRVAARRREGITSDTAAAVTASSTPACLFQGPPPRPPSKLVQPSLPLAAAGPWGPPRPATTPACVRGCYRADGELEAAPAPGAWAAWPRTRAAANSVSREYFVSP